MKRWSYLSILLILLASVLPATAQSPWYAYFYNSTDGTLIHIAEDGSTEDFSLGLGELRISQYDLSFANTRPEVAYCTVAVNSGQIPSQGSTKLVIRDIPNQQNRIEIELGLSDSCRAGVYNSNDSLIAVGLLRHFGDGQAANPQDPRWEILLIDTNTGAFVYSLNSNEPASSIVIPWEGGSPGDYFIPRVFAIDADGFSFETVPTEGPGMRYSFNLSSREITLNMAWGLSYDSFAEEEIWLARLEEYPMATDFGYYGTHNALMYVDAGGAAKIIYYTADWSLDQARFINGGQQIAMQLSNTVFPQDTNLPPETTTKWIVIDREGNESDLLTNSSYNDGIAWHSLSVHPTATGYSILEVITNYNTDERSYHLSRVENGVRVQIWEHFIYTDTDWSLLYMPEMPSQEFPAFPEFDMSSIPTVQ